MLTKQDFIDRKPVVKKVEIPEWNDFVYIKKISAKERVQLVKNSTKVEGKEVSLDQDNFMNTIVQTVQVVLCDEKGVRLFDDSIEDFDMLNEKEGAILERLFDEITAFNGMGIEAENEALGNSETSQI
jgi:hypothetical protein